MTSIMEIMTHGGSMINEKGATELPDEWEALQFKK
jgi:hypothetical protein